MDFKTLVKPAEGLHDIAADALLVVVGSEAAAKALGGAVGQALRAALRSEDFALKPARCVYLHQVAGVKAARLAFVAMGSGAGSSTSTAKAFKAAVAAGLGALKSGGARHVCVAVAGDDVDAAQAEALVAAASHATYVYRATKPTAAQAWKLQRVSLVCGAANQAAVQEALRRGQAIAQGVALACECANRPGNVATPSYLAEQARKLGKQHGLKVQVLERAQVAKLGMGSFLAVAQGSAQPLKFIVMQYQGAAKGVAPVVLVGKGITFDSGGISIKPAGEMDEMKFDMGGAASVLGTMAAVAQLKAKVNLIGVIPACENMPSSTAVKPGDVVTSMSGQTIEILNTDAEGRLILCDALTYAERFKPKAVVDIATLTGACVVALGHVRSGLFSADEALATALLDAGQAALDPCWRMPLDDDYDEGLKSNFADMANVAGRAGGAITAAMFLKRFTAKFNWAHLDVAGTAWKSGTAKGATGRPVGLLTHYVLAQAR